jgi:hypothetical protein
LRKRLSRLDWLKTADIAEQVREKRIIVNNIIQRLKDAYSENPAKVLELLPELFKQYEEGKIVVLPCKIGDIISQIWYSEADSKDIIVSDTINRIAINSKGITLYSKNFCPINTKEFELAPIENYNDISYADYWIGAREAAEKALEEQKK